MSRDDLMGMFWEDVVEVRGSKEKPARTMPAIPDTGWEPPIEFPNLFHEKVIGLDTETRDPMLKTHGPGWGRDAGEVCGISLATEDGHSWYFPIRHQVQQEMNMDAEKVFKYLSDLLGRPSAKVGANLLYDIGWLDHEGVAVKGKLYDVQYAEAILFDTAQSYSLEAVANRWLGQGKEDELLYAWSAKAYGGKAIRSAQAGNIHRCPPAIVGPYAEQDAHLPIEILKKQWKMLEKDNLLNIFELECALIPVLLGMRLRGMPVDLEKAEEARIYLQEKEDIAQSKLDQEAGFSVGVYTSGDLSRLFDKKKLKYPRTALGAPSFTKGWLAAHEHPIALQINEVRKYNKARTAFIENAIIDKEVKGKIHPSLHPLRGENGGAVSGRFSSSNPNGQQFPARDPELGPLTRGIFIPEINFPSWIKQDLSQIEYRYFAHFSGDQKLISSYQHRDVDYHNMVSEFLGNMMPRKIVKNFNFGSLYGMGRGKTTRMLSAEFTKEQAEELLLNLCGQIPPGNLFTQLANVFLSLYDTNFPSASASLKRDLAIAEKHGEIRTILGRRSTFELWEPINRRNSKALERKDALDEYGLGIKRAFCFRALNRRLQGSSADLLKKGMLDAYNEGVFERIGYPHITVHDELDNSYHPDLKKDFYQLQQIIENAIPMSVPIIMDAEIGNNWGAVKSIDLSEG